MRFRLPILLLALAIVLAACGPAKVNLFAVKAGFDRHKAGINEAQSVYDARRAELQEILAATHRPGDAPYPDLQAELGNMAAGIQGMRAASAKIDAFKPKFDAYAQGKSIVSEDDPAGWAEYQGVMAEYNALMGELNYQANGFNTAQKRYVDLMAHNKIQKVDLASLRGEVVSSTRTVTEGVERMDLQLEADRKALQFARRQNGDNAQLVQKDGILDQMERMLPALRLSSVSLQNAQESTLRSLRGQGNFWVGPGMNERVLAAVDQFRAVTGQYREDHRAWDDLQVEFDAALAPTPVPTAAPAAGH